MKVAVLQSNDWESWAERHRKGQVNSALPYGADHLRDMGWQVHHPQAQWTAGVRNTLVLGPSRSIERLSDAKLAHPLSALMDREVRTADAAFSIFEDMAWPWVLPGLRLPPLFIVSCWLGQRLLLKDERAAQRWAHLLRRSVGVSVFSSNQVPILVNRLGLAASKIHVVPFGTDTSWFCPPTKARSGDYVLAAGADVGRDWPTFFAAAALLPHVRFRVLIAQKRLAGLTWPANVTLETAYGVDYREALQEALAVVISTHPLAYPTGQSVLLNAFASGAPVVATSSPALREYAHEDACISVAPGDPGAIAAALDGLLRDGEARISMGQAGRKVALERYSTRHMWSALAEAVQRGIS